MCCIHKPFLVDFPRRRTRCHKSSDNHEDARNFPICTLAPETGALRLLQAFSSSHAISFCGEEASQLLGWLPFRSRRLYQRLPAAGCQSPLKLALLTLKPNRLQKVGCTLHFKAMYLDTILLHPKLAFNIPACRTHPSSVGINIRYQNHHHLILPLHPQTGWLSRFEDLILNWRSGDGK